MAGRRLTRREHKMSGLAKDKAFTNGYAVSDRLRKVLDDDASPASAKVFAARTLAEMDGLIGKHQVAPSNLPTAQLNSLSREQLQAELTRLRALVDIGALR